MRLVTVDDIRDAAQRIAGAVVHTPLLPWPVTPGSPPGSPLWLKPESLQLTGAFKLRGAHNAVARLDERTRGAGIVGYSSGNHAQALAYAARTFGVPAHIVIPHGTPLVKVDATRRYGAEVVLVAIEEREAAALELAKKLGAALIPPFDHPDVIAGQGTIGLEIAEDLPDVDVVLVPVSGGGLASGIGVAIKALRPQASVIGVEPALAADVQESLRAGRVVHWPAARRTRTIADGLRAQPSELTFAHLSQVLDDLVTVTEDDIRSAVRALADQARLVAEPSGAVATAAYLYHWDELPRGRTVSVVSGGNVDRAALAAILGS